MSTLDYYNLNAESYISNTVGADVSDLYAHFEPLLQTGASILDLGCGSGRDSRHFLDAGFRVTAIDGSSEFCRLASAYLGMPVRQLLFSELDYEAEFDAVWACASLLHVPRNELYSVLGLVVKALKPGGILYMSFKYGSEQRESGGRLFSDYSERDIEWIGQADPDLIYLSHWISGDVRQDRSGERWLNLLFRKR